MMKVLVIVGYDKAANGEADAVLLLGDSGEDEVEKVFEKWEEQNGNGETYAYNVYEVDEAYKDMINQE